MLDFSQSNNEKRIRAILRWNDYFIGEGTGSARSHPAIDKEMMQIRERLKQLAACAADNLRQCPSQANLLQAEALQQMLLPNGSKYKYCLREEDKKYL